MIIKIFITAFVLFAMSRLILRFKDGDVNTKEFIFWLLLWLSIIIITFIPSTANLMARLLGVGRGSDAMIYISIIVIFYAIFKISVKLEHIEHEITKIVRRETLRNNHDSNNRHNS